jgi:hypothetical protein
LVCNIISIAALAQMIVGPGGIAAYGAGQASDGYWTRTGGSPRRAIAGRRPTIYTRRLFFLKFPPTRCSILHEQVHCFEYFKQLLCFIKQIELCRKYT